jgi:single-stranded-DNA-specific exonuclease
LQGKPGCGINQADEIIKGASLSHTYWNLLPQIENTDEIDGVPSLIVQLLRNRNISDPKQIELFLSNDTRVEADPFLLPDIQPAVSRIYRALLSGEKIVIYGDFDADGITATALLVQGLSALGGDVIPYIPHRTAEGYGLRASALEKLHQQGISLVITVDTGITAFAEIKRAQKLGMDVIITDHHVPLSTLPPALAVVDPKRSDSIYPTPDIAGVGVAFKLLHAVVKGNGRENILKRSLDLVALGTVTDMVPLVGENRYWVTSGLDLLNRTQRLGLQELMRYTRLQPGNLDAQSISWVLGPRINAAGRIDNATTSYRLLMTDNQEEASSLAVELENKNSERLKQTNELLDKAVETIVAAGIERPLLMAGGEDFAPGVMGLVAGRLADRYYRPVIIFKIGREISRGSARSINQFDLMVALKECQDMLSNFGGHTRAAGFTIPTRNLNDFQNRIYDLAKKKLEGLDLRPHVDIDADVPLSTFRGDTFERMQQLAPFGMGNPLPTFLSRRVEVNEMRQVGGKKEHIKLRLKHDGITWDAIGFGLGDYSEEITTYLDIVYNLDLDRWNGEEKLRLSLLDFHPVQ